jgi:hypothetical protein
MDAADYVTKWVEAKALKTNIIAIMANFYMNFYLYILVVLYTLLLIT